MRNSFVRKKNCKYQWSAFTSHKLSRCLWGIQIVRGAVKYIPLFLQRLLTLSIHKGNHWFWNQRCMKHTMVTLFKKYSSIGLLFGKNWQNNLRLVVLYFLALDNNNYWLETRSIRRHTIPNLLKLNANSNQLWLKSGT